MTEETNKNIKKKPFVNYTLEEDRDTDYKNVFSVRLNKQETQWLEEIKEDLNIKSNGKALKMAAFIGKNVLQGLLTRKILRYLFNPNREKLTNHKNY